MYFGVVLIRVFLNPRVFFTVPVGQKCCVGWEQTTLEAILEVIDVQCHTLGILVNLLKNKKNPRVSGDDRAKPPPCVRFRPVSDP